MNKELILFCGPPGSGKSTNALQDFHTNSFDTVYINQDKHGKEGHKKLFAEAIANGSSIICDRMNFSKEQRNRYLVPAKQTGYKTRIIVLHESYETCFMRCLERQNHETITTEQHARKALEFFFKNYERVEDNEADEVIRIWPELCNGKYKKSSAIICDLDGTLCNVDHRLHFVKGEKRDWNAFFRGLKDDKLNTWCSDILNASLNHHIILCSGRPDSYREETIKWLDKHNIVYDALFMRDRNDFRRDDIVKEQILDFEILTRYTPYFSIDDRKQVVEMWRRRGITCLQCAEGDF